MPLGVKLIALMTLAVLIIQFFAFAIPFVSIKPQKVEV